MGPLTRTVADAELLLDVLAGFDPADRHSLHPVPTAGRPAAAGRGQRGPRLRRRGRRRAAGLRARRRRPRRRRRRGRPRRAGDRSVRRDLGDHRHRGGPLVEATEYEQPPSCCRTRCAGYLAFGETVTADAYVRAQFEREQHPRRVRRLVRPHRRRCAVHPDRGLRRVRQRPALPRADRRRPGRPSRGGTGRPCSTTPTSSGCPRAPCRSAPERHGLPVGGQLLGPRLADRTVLRIAELLQNTLDPPTAPPTRG